MGLSHSPKIVTDGLVLCLDAGNSSKSAKGFKNLLNLSTWTLGTGGVTGFSVNGTVDENRRILDTGPFGVSTLVWDTPSNDATSDADGGWNGTSVPIDKTKLYRFSVWIRRKVIGNGLYYLGCSGGVLNRSNEVLNNNPYFSAGGWPTASVPVESWMLVVGHIWPAGSGIGVNHPDSGLWNTSGVKFSGPTSAGDFIWQTTSTTTSLRSYLFYSTDTTTSQQWYQPRIDLCDGTEPTIAELISGVGSRWYDLSGTNHGTIINSPAIYNSNGHMNFDGVDDFISSTNSYTPAQTINYTISVWFRTTTASGRKLIGIEDSQTGINAGNYDKMLYMGTNGKIHKAMYNNTFQIIQSTNALNDGVWHNAVGTYDSSNLRLYIDGILNGTISMSASTMNTSGWWKLGGYKLNGWSNGGDGYYTGDIAAAYVYHRALTSSEVSQNFNSLRGRYGI